MESLGGFLDNGKWSRSKAIGPDGYSSSNGSLLGELVMRHEGAEKQVKRVEEVLHLNAMKGGDGVDLCQLGSKTSAIEHAGQLKHEA